MDELKNRIEILEKEVKVLKKELYELRKQTVGTQQQKESFIEQVEPIKEKEVTIPEETSSLEKANVTLETKQKQKKPQKSFEEQLSNLLPKVFMFIFVLGVLWGLKLMSDYGILNDFVKIMLSYALSIGLGVFAWRLDKKDKGAYNVRLAMLGGSFVIGVLATAAAVMIYDLFSLQFGLIVALLYIGYGVFLCNWKPHQGLTIFVMITSLLLPYLLEYMDFKSIYIISFIILLYSVMMWVMKSHHQAIALYVTTSFAFLSVYILYWMNEQPTIMYGYGSIVMLAVFFAGWMKLRKQVQQMAIHLGLLFSIGTFGIMMLHVIQGTIAEQVILFAVIAIVASVFWYLNKTEQASDVFATLAIIAIGNGLLKLDLHEDLEIILLLSISFAGIVIGIRHHATLMKCTNSLMFAFLTLVIIGIYGVTDFIFILIQLAPVIYLVILITLSEKTAIIGRFSTRLNEMRWNELMRCVITVLLLIFFYKIDMEYLESTSYLMLIVLAFIAIFSFVLPAHIAKIIWPRFMFILFMIGTIGVWSSGNTDQSLFIQIVTRLIYLGITIALILDIYYKGEIYKRFKDTIDRYLEQFLLISGFILLMSLWTFSYLFVEFQYIHLMAHYILTTVLLFGLSALDIVIGLKQSFDLFKKVGFLLIFIALAKLIFYDLSTLSLLVRTIFFMIIGAIGLLLSNKLLKKNNENKEQ